MPHRGDVLLPGEDEGRMGAEQEMDHFEASLFLRTLRKRFPTVDKCDHRMTICVFILAESNDRA